MGEIPGRSNVRVQIQIGNQPLDCWLQLTHEMNLDPITEFITYVNSLAQPVQEHVRFGYKLASIAGINDVKFGRIQIRLNGALEVFRVIPISNDHEFIRTGHTRE